MNALNETSEPLLTVVADRCRCRRRRRRRQPPTTTSQVLVQCAQNSSTDCAVRSQPRTTTHRQNFVLVSRIDRAGSKRPRANATHSLLQSNRETQRDFSLRVAMRFGLRDSFPRAGECVCALRTRSWRTPTRTSLLAVSVVALVGVASLCLTTVAAIAAKKFGEDFETVWDRQAKHRSATLATPIGRRRLRSAHSSSVSRESQRGGRRQAARDVRTAHRRAPIRRRRQRRQHRRAQRARRRRLCAHGSTAAAMNEPNEPNETHTHTPKECLLI